MLAHIFIESGIYISPTFCRCLQNIILTRSQHLAGAYTFSSSYWISFLCSLFYCCCCCVWMNNEWTFRVYLRTSFTFNLFPFSERPRFSWLATNIHFIKSIRPCTRFQLVFSFLSVVYTLQLPCFVLECSNLPANVRHFCSYEITLVFVWCRRCFALSFHLIYNDILPIQKASAKARATISNSKSVSLKRHKLHCQHKNHVRKRSSTTRYMISWLTKKKKSELQNENCVCIPGFIIQ